jgi:hypothetical protein
MVRLRSKSHYLHVSISISRGQLGGRKDRTKRIYILLPFFDALGIFRSTAYPQNRTKRHKPPEVYVRDTLKSVISPPNAATRLRDFMVIIVTRPGNICKICPYAQLTLSNSEQSSQVPSTHLSFEWGRQGRSRSCR